MCDINAIIEAMCEAFDEAWSGRTREREAMTAALIAGLTAMREPSEGMQDAGEFGACDSPACECDLGAIWQAMVDHLLTKLSERAKR